MAESSEESHPPEIPNVRGCKSDCERTRTHKIDLGPIKSLLPKDTKVLVSNIHNPAALGDNYFTLLGKCAELMYNEATYSEVRTSCEILIDMAWEKLNSGYWKDVDINWRYAYTIASVMKTFCECGLLQENKQGVLLADVMKSCDMGLLMGAPILDNILAKMSTGIQDVFNPSRKRRTCDGTKGELDKKDIAQGSDAKIRKETTVVIDSSAEVPRCSCPSLEKFRKDFMDVKQPVIITDAINFWPALSNRTWSLEYIKQKAGYRTVPIELGSSYTEESWSQNLMTINEFIETYIENPKQETVGYLAQHQLFDQIPELNNDISVPAYCSLKDEETDSDEVDINAWFGPRGTVSPLHYDAKHNLLSQVVGKKYIRLYSESVTESLYPHPYRLLFNTSQVDVENPDLEKFPLFASAPYLECILEPGEMLYIPPKYWHFVRSLTVSFSVSFWWE